MSATDRELALRTCISAWGTTGRQQYPWRRTRDPYRVLVAEFMLHRTQAAQVVPVYEKFICRYPTLAAYGEGDATEARHILLPLGLHWRIQAMLDALCDLWTQYREVPLDPALLKTVRGIGDYIANATVCFSTDIPLVLVDTNTVRVVARVLGLKSPGEARRDRSVIDAIYRVLDAQRPSSFYYSLIDFAHAICTSRTPSCTECPCLRIPCSYGVVAIL